MGADSTPVATPPIMGDEAPLSIESDKPEEPETDKAEPSGVYTITYGTHMAIDAIYMFLDKDFEDMGYNDAMCSTDGSYKESGERIIRNELKTLFRRVTLRYKEDQRNLSTTIRMVKQQGMLDQASALESKMDTVNEHLEEIKSMEHNLDNNEPSMMRPIESYSRGFLKGLTAKTNVLLSN